MNIKEDMPIRALNEDELGRKRLVHLIVDAIEHKVKSSHPSVTIGVYGAWGEGKTSLMYMVKDELEKNDHKHIIWYNPWSANDENMITMDFFSLLSSAAYDNTDIKTAIENYGRSFLIDECSKSYSPVIASYMTRLSQCIPSVGKGLDELKNTISKKLKEGDIHPIVFIDDTDRLNSNEIRTLFKLIRQIVDFENVIYIIGLDPSIVAESLGLPHSTSSQENSNSKGRAFLEKIIQIPIVLPTIDESVIVNLIRDTLEDVAKDFKVKIDRKNVDRVSGILSSALTTKRSIIRFGNQLRFVLPSIYRETEFVDLCLTESLKYLNEQGWIEIYRYKSNLLLEVPYYIVADKDREAYKKEAYDNAIKTIVLYYPKEFQKYVEMVLTKHLFPYRRYSRDNELLKSICKDIYFDQYFICGVPEGTIPRREAEAFMSLMQHNRKKAISWINNKLEDYSSEEIDRTARLALKMVRENNMPETAGKLCVILALSDLAEGFSNNLVSNPTTVDLTITAVIIPQYMIKNVQGVRVNETTLESEVLKEIFEKAPLNFCLNVLFGVYSAPCFPPEDEKGTFEVLRDRVIEEGDMKIFDYSYNITQIFLKVWKDTNNSNYVEYIKRVLNDNSFNAGNFIVDSLESVNPDNQLTAISAITYLFMDVWTLFLNRLSEYPDKDDKLYNLFLFNCESSKRRIESL